jgi:hypothetical protein
MAEVPKAAGIGGLVAETDARTRVRIDRSMAALALQCALDRRGRSTVDTDDSHVRRFEQEPDEQRGPPRVEAGRRRGAVPLLDAVGDMRADRAQVIIRRAKLI